MSAINLECTVFTHGQSLFVPTSQFVLIFMFLVYLTSLGLIQFHYRLSSLFKIHFHMNAFNESK